MFTNINGDFTVFFEALDLLIKGMVGIFIFMVVFYLVVKVLDKLYPINKDQGE